MQRLYKPLILTVIFILSIYSSKAQLPFSSYVDSIIGLTDTSNIILLVRQLSGDTSVVINGQPHTFTSRYCYNEQNALATQFIIDKFEEYGYSPETQIFNGGTGANVIATKTGTLYPDKFFILCAHYDSYSHDSIAPGADDNASGTAAMLEAARLFFNIPTPYSIKFIAFDEEEIGLFGSMYFAEQAVDSGLIIPGVINIDMIAHTSDDDFLLDLCREGFSSQLAHDFESSVGFYHPNLSINFDDCSASDHYAFWMNNFQAIGLVQAHSDFNPFYHSAEDLIDKFNFDYYFSITKSAYATLLGNALELRYNFVHEPIQSSNITSPILVEVLISGSPVGEGDNTPRLYYSLDSLNYDYLLPFESVGDTFRFMIPGFPYGTNVNYYFAVQDQTGNLSMTNPAGGYGSNPPGTIAPSLTYHYLVDDIFTFDACSNNTPLPLPVNSTTNDEFTTNTVGRIYDLNVKIDITHASTQDLSIFLTGPDNTSIMLAGSVGGTGNNYTQTVFDDEATLSISDGTPPFTGNYRPIVPLNKFKNKYSDGTWKLSVDETNSYNAGGLLNSWCLHFVLIDTIVSTNDLMPGLLVFKCYPNPAKDILEIKLIVNESINASLSIYNQTGSLVKSIPHFSLQPGANLLVTSIEDLQSGIYFIKATSNKYTGTSKLVIVK